MVLEWGLHATAGKGGRDGSSAINMKIGTQIKNLIRLQAEDQNINADD